MKAGFIMIRYIIKRILYMILTLFIIITITFFLMNSLPGDPIQNSAKQLPDQVRSNLLAKYGLDKPVTEQYFIYLKNILQGDLGESIKTPGLSASQIIKERFPASARLGFQAVIVGLIVGVFLGLLAALNRGTVIDYIVMIFAIIGVSIPSFVLAMLLQKTLGGGMLPIVGWPIEKVWTSGFKYTVLPTIALSVGGIATYARYMRASVLDVVNQDYILTAKAKGLTNFKIVKKHVIRNAFLPIITILGPQIAGILTGSFVIERIFSIPGLGEYFVSCITGRDYTMIMATAIFFSFMFIVALLMVDILYPIIDPRINLANNKE